MTTNPISLFPQWFKNQQENYLKMSLTDNELTKRWTNLSGNFSVPQTTPSAFSIGTPQPITSMPSFVGKTTTVSTLPQQPRSALSYFPESVVETVFPVIKEIKGISSTESFLQQSTAEQNKAILKEIPAAVKTVGQDVVKFMFGLPIEFGLDVVSSAKQLAGGQSIKEINIPLMGKVQPRTEVVKKQQEQSSALAQSITSDKTLQGVITVLQPILTEDLFRALATTGTAFRAGKFIGKVTNFTKVAQFTLPETNIVQPNVPKIEQILFGKDRLQKYEIPLTDVNGKTGIAQISQTRGGVKIELYTPRGLKPPISETTQLIPFDVLKTIVPEGQPLPPIIPQPLARWSQAGFAKIPFVKEPITGVAEPTEPVKPTETPVKIPKGYKFEPTNGYVKDNVYFTNAGEPIKIGDKIEMGFAGRPANMPQPWILKKAENYFSSVGYNNKVRITVEAKNGKVMTFDNADYYSPHPVKEALSLAKQPEVKPLAQSAQEAVAKGISKEADITQILRGTKGMTADQIMQAHPNIKLTKDLGAKDVYGNKVEIPKDEVLTPYEMKDGKIVLQDGQTYVVSKNQYQNIKGNAVTGEAKPFALELAGVEESVKVEGKQLSYRAIEGKDTWTLKNTMTGEQYGVIRKKTAKTESEAIAYALEHGYIPKPTKYSPYQLPGGKNYKEILIKAPEGKITEVLPSDIEIKNVTKPSDAYETFDIYVKGEKYTDTTLRKGGQMTPHDIEALKIQHARNINSSAEGDLVRSGFKKVPEMPTERFKNIVKEVQAIAETKKATEMPIVETKAPFVLPKRPPSLRQLGVQPPLAPEVTITGREDVLLRNKLRLEQRASKLGYKTGVYETRIKLIDQFRTTREDIKDLKNQVVDYLKANLPLNVRGKFLTMVKDVHTQDGLAKAFFRADKEIANVAKKELIIQLKKNINRINNSQQVAVDYKQKINGILNAIEIKGHNQTTIDRLKKTNEYIKKQEALGNDVEMPKRILEALDILNRKPLSDMSLIDVGLLNDKILTIEKMGKTKWRTLQSLYDIEKQQKKQELIENTFSIETRERVKPGIGENLTINQRINNAVVGAFNFTQRVDLAITPMDVIFDLLDGSVGYTGSNYKIFKKQLDNDFGGYLDLKDKYGDQAWKWAERYDLKDKNFEKIGVYAAKMQEGGMEKLLNSGYKEEEINNIVLTKNEIAFYEIMRKNLDALRPLIEDLMRTVYNQQLGDVKNYFSFMTDWQAMDEAEVYQRIGNVEEYGMPTKRPEMGFTKQRTGAGKQKIKINAMEIYLRHIDNATYLITMARDLKMLFEIANSPEYKAVGGDRGQKIVVEWLDLMARKGGTSGQIQLAILDTLRKNVGAAVLGFRLSSTLIQPTALLDGAGLIGNYTFKGVNNVLGTNGKEWRIFLRDNFPELRDRGLDDPAFTEFAENKMLAKMQKIGFAPMKSLDAITASAITSGAYIKYLDEHNIPLDFNNPNQEAITEAEKILRRTQSSPLFKDVPLAISKGALTGNKSIDKVLLQFQNFMLNRWSLIRHDLYRTALKLPDPIGSDYKTNERNFKRAFSIFFWLSMASIAGVGIRRGTRKVLSMVTESDVSQSSFVKELMQEYLTTVPFISQYVSMAVYGREPIPGLDVLSNLALESYAVTTGQGKKTETKLRHWIKLLTAILSTQGITGSSQLQQLLINMTYSKKGDNQDLDFNNLDFSNINLGEQNFSNMNLNNLDFSNINLGE